MDENNIIKKKNKNKNYYRHNNYNHNQNKNYYYKKKKKKNLIVESNDQEEVKNILLFNENNNQELIEEIPQKKSNQVVEEEPQKKVIQEQSNQIINEIDTTPVRKNAKKSVFKDIFKNLFAKRKFKYGLGFAVLLVAVLGTSYSFFSYRAEHSRQADIASGEVYVKLVENAVNITLNKMYPRTPEEARLKEDNYVDFTVKAKNTSTTKAVFYQLNINDGEDVQNKTRINPQYIKVDLQEKVGNEYTYIKEAEPLSTFSFKGTVPTDTTSEITKEYRLRIWISDDIIISDTEQGASYTQAQFANLYANFNIDVNSYDGIDQNGTRKVLAAIAAKEATGGSCGNITYEEDEITYLSGSNTCIDMNYVWYSGKLWRITAIYPDGSMKLITQNNITSIAFNESGQVNFYTDSNTTSYMYQWLNEDFYDTLYNANNFIDTSKQWNATMPSDTNVSIKPLETNMVTANVGLLNNYEYYNSYRCINSSTCIGSNYGTGFLYIGYLWWLLNPYNASDVWYVNNNGYGSNDNPTYSNGVRPSIYLKSGLEFTGDGSKQSPYKIVGDKDTGVANELVNTRISGEYVKLKNGNNEQLFRIIGVEDNKTKIIAMDYADNKAAKKFATSTGTANTLWGSGTTTNTDTWYTYLNDNSTGYLKNLKDAYGELFDSGLYYLGTSGYNYKLSVCANTTSENTKVCDKTSDKGTFNIGLPRYGEMFATQQAGGQSNSIDMWLMNKYGSSLVWNVLGDGRCYNYLPTSTNGVRPTVHLKSTVKIISGTGTETDPYVVGLSS